MWQLLLLLKNYRLANNIYWVVLVSCASRKVLKKVEIVKHSLAEAITLIMDIGINTQIKRINVGRIGELYA